MLYLRLTIQRKNGDEYVYYAPMPADATEDTVALFLKYLKRVTMFKVVRWEMVRETPL